MKIIEATIYKLNLPLNAPFETSAVYMNTKKTLILALKDDKGNTGFGECSALERPFYSEEFRDGALILLEFQLLPMIVGHYISHPDDTEIIFKAFRNNRMAKSAINSALWDLFSKQNNMPLYKALGGNKNNVETGVSIGIQESPNKLVSVVKSKIDEGYRRIKVKIKPGKDFSYLKAVREKYPDITLTADANSSYSLDSIQIFQEMDSLNLDMIEQPLEPGDLVNHSELQSKIKTPICLDESISSLDDAIAMVKLGSGKIINIKVSRVGGLTMSKKIQEYALKHNIDCWSGGMLDTGIQRVQNIAIATLPGYTLANDIAPSTRYFDNDIISPTVTLNGSYIDVPQGIGMGYNINWLNLQKYTSETKIIR
ncbi:o-succinylbenzoate synthase [Leuconostoc mesenteroides]|uniref:o-succinylbenzoate synthase n=1 Tax=Leuconostoc mesenteroides TaxID=1245 RepID=UPI003C51AC32